MKTRETQERNPCASKFEDMTVQETLQLERCARREAWDLAKKVYKLKAMDRPRFTPYRSLGSVGTLFNKARVVRIRGRFRSIDAHAEQKGLKLSITGYP